MQNEKMNSPITNRNSDLCKSSGRTPLGERNESARQHSDGTMRALSQSIRRFGTPRCVVFLGSLLVLLALSVTGCVTSQRSLCDLPGRYSIEISESQVPSDILGAFHTAFPDRELRRVRLFIAGDRLLFYILNFREDGKLRRVHIRLTGEVGPVFDDPYQPTSTREP
jgi:hypothetical protein